MSFNLQDLKCTRSHVCCMLFRSTIYDTHAKTGQNQLKLIWKSTISAVRAEYQYTGSHVTCPRPIREQKLSMKSNFIKLKPRSIFGILWSISHNIQYLNSQQLFYYITLKRQRKNHKQILQRYIYIVHVSAYSFSITLI